MPRKFFLMSISLISITTIHLTSQPQKPQRKKVDLVLNVHGVKINRDFSEDIIGNSLSYMSGLAQNLKKYPKTFFSLAGGAFGYSLYHQEILDFLYEHNNAAGNGIQKYLHNQVDTVKPKLKIQSFIDEHKHIIFSVGICSLLLAYLKKDVLFKKIPDVKYDNSLHDGKDNELNMSEFSKSSVRIYRPGEIKTTFKDVAGLDSAKDEMSDLVMFLKDADKFAKIGAKVPKGVLLAGDPGNGKTLLARALAGEVQCPFLYVSGSEFIQAIVGIGAARVRNLFAIARDLAPCIIFIDEIDAIGRKRGNHGFGGDTELAQTLNQLLVEMDGFEQQKDAIVVIGATNRVDILDSALTRPGRFDRKVEIGLPFIQDRYKILSLYLNTVKTDPNLDIFKIARGTPGYSGADLEHLINEAAILALRDGKNSVSMLHIDQARDNINLGRETKGMQISQKEYWQTAVHEAGHALALVYQEHADPLHKVTIVPRSGALGITFSMGKERYSKFIENFKAQIVYCLGGSVAEEIMYNGRGAGAHSDLQKARALATQMVMSYGMTEEFKDITFERYVNDEVHLPDDLASKLQAEVSKIIHECRQVAYNILSKHKDKLEKLVAMLLEQGTVYGSDVYKLCGLKEPDIEYTLTQ